MSKRTSRIFEKASFSLVVLLALNLNSNIQAQDEPTRVVPLFPSSNDTYSGALRIINHSKEAGDIAIVGFDEEGTEYGPATLSIGSQVSQLIYTDEIEDGTETLTNGLGRGVGSWRLELTTPLNIEATAYAVTQDGLLSGLQETVQGENGCWRIPTF